MHGVRNLHQTHYIFPIVFKVASAVDRILEKHNLSNCIFSELYDHANFDHTLTWRFGSPNINFFVFAPNHQYLDRVNPFLNQWKTSDIDPNITDHFGSKYIPASNKIQLPDQYNLFLMQDSIGAEYDHLMDAINYANDRKVYTIFKQHPLTQITIPESKYAIFADANCNLDHLLDNAERVFSSWSSVSVNAMIRGKPVASYDTTAFSEILPMINTAYELEDVQPVDQTDLKRFLSWYAHELCIDVTYSNFEERIEQRIINFK
jgi:hypothetical protein